MNKLSVCVAFVALWIVFACTHSSCDGVRLVRHQTQRHTARATAALSARLSASAGSELQDSEAIRQTESKRRDGKKAFQKSPRPETKPTSDDEKKYGSEWWWSGKTNGDAIPAIKYDANGYGPKAKVPKDAGAGQALAKAFSQLDKAIRDMKDVPNVITLGVDKGGKVVANVFGVTAADLTKGSLATFSKLVSSLGGSIQAKADKSGKLQEQAFNNVAVGDLLGADTGAADIPAGTVGACLRRARLGLWRNDAVITSFHGMAKVGAKIMCGSSDPSYCGKVVVNAFDAVAEPIVDYTVVQLNWDWGCTCSQIAPATEDFQNLEAMIATLSGEQDAYVLGGMSGGRVNGKFDPSDFLAYNLKFAEDPSRWHRMLKASMVTIKGDSGSSLVVAGKSIGFLKGGDAQSFSYFTPIWNVAIPATYEIC